MSQNHTHIKENLILTAARKRFAYYGFSKVTMDEIAADVGLAKPSLYYYYPTKESLFRAVIAHEHAHFLQKMNALLNERMPPDELLRKYVEMRFQLFRESVNLSALGVHSWIEVNAMPWDLFKSIEDQEFNLVHSILCAGRASGEFELPNPRQTATLLLHVLHGLRLRSLRTAHGPRIDDEGYTELQKEMAAVIELLVSGFKRPSSN